MQSDNRNCRNPECGKLIPAGAHDNRRYCSKQCKINFEVAKTRGKNQRLKPLIQITEKNLQILEILLLMDKPKVTLYELKKWGFDISVIHIPSRKGLIKIPYFEYTLYFKDGKVEIQK